MKKNFNPNSKYFTVSVYVVIVSVICAVIFKAIFSLSSTLSFLKDLLNTLSPFLIGFFIAYLMSPFVNFINKAIVSRIAKGKQPKLCRLISIFLAYAVVLAACIAAVVYIIPTIFENITEIVSMLSSLYSSIIKYIDVLAENYPSLDFEYIRNTITNAFPTIMSYLSEYVSDIVPQIYSASVTIISMLVNLLVAVIVSCYMVNDKKIMKRGLKRFIYAFFKESSADYLWSTLARANGIFSGFIFGKMVDSLIMGILCYIMMRILGLPYALFISLIVGVTNMIPYFGPFLGAIPSAIILLVVSPMTALEFVILILVLQQIDGNLIGPRILGDTTGLRPLWIIFAISLGGWAAGVVGMFLGVPCVAVISSLLNDATDKRLAEKGLDMPVVKPERLIQKKEKEGKKKKS